MWVKVKNLARLATSNNQKRVVNINSLPIEERHFLTFRMMPHANTDIMHSDTRVSIKLLDALIEETKRGQESIFERINKSHPTYTRGKSTKRVHRSFDAQLDVFDTKLNLLRSLKILFQKYQKHKLMKMTGVMKSTPGMLRWSKRARDTYWRPGGGGALSLQNKYKNKMLK